VVRLEEEGKKDRLQQQRHLVTNTRVLGRTDKRKVKKKKKGKKERRGKNYYTKFFGGKLLFENLHPPYSFIYLVQKILNWRPVYQKISTCVTKHFELWVVHTKNFACGTSAILLTPWSRVLLEKLTSKFPAFTDFCRLAGKNLRDGRVAPRSS
jgi:hypothetical protein